MLYVVVLFFCRCLLFNSPWNPQVCPRVYKAPTWIAMTVRGERKLWNILMSFYLFFLTSVTSFSDTVYSGQCIQILNEKLVFAVPQEQFRPVHICHHSAWQLRTKACNVAWPTRTRQGTEWNFISLLCSFWETFHLLSASDKEISKMSARSLFFFFVGEVAVQTAGLLFRIGKFLFLLHANYAWIRNQINLTMLSLVLS
jgi:hypothetical protein